VPEVPYLSIQYPTVAPDQRTGEKNCSRTTG
jgi:hypothetical protein